MTQPESPVKPTTAKVRAVAVETPDPFAVLGLLTIFLGLAALLGLSLLS